MLPEVRLLFAILINLNNLAPCNHGEADTRILMHVRHSVEKRQNVLITANDTDILVIAVSVFSSIREYGFEKLWLEFGRVKMRDGYFRKMLVM